MTTAAETPRKRSPRTDDGAGAQSEPEQQAQPRKSATKTTAQARTAKKTTARKAAPQKSTPRKTTPRKTTPRKSTSGQAAQRQQATGRTDDAAPTRVFEQNVAAEQPREARGSAD